MTPSVPLTPLTSRRFQPGLHPAEKRVVAAGAAWCCDVLDRFVGVDESVAVGDVVVRSYTPATPHQATVMLHLYATHRPDAKVQRGRRDL